MEIVSSLFENFIWNKSLLSTEHKNIQWLNQFLVLLYNWVPNLKHILNIDKLLKNTNFSQLEASKNPTTTLYCETINPEKLLMK